MFRLFLALNLLLITLYACKGGYDSCIRKVKDSNAIVNNTLQIPVDTNKFLIYSTTPPNKKIIKHDPFLSLYLVEGDVKFKYPFRINKNLSLGVASVNGTSAVEGKIAREQVGLNSFATFSEPLYVPALLLNSCCALEGIVTPHGIITRDYIDRFLSIENVEYSDIGIRVEDRMEGVTVTSSNPFMKHNRLNKGDIIIELNSKKIENASGLMRDILFSKIGVLHKLKIKRGAKEILVEALSQKRVGGGYLSDTFLELFGFSFDEGLYVTGIVSQAQKYGVNVGDRLLSVNGIGVKNEYDIAEMLGGDKKDVKLLFQRGGFQFFVKVN